MGRLIDNLGVVPDVDIGAEHNVLTTNRDGEIDIATKLAVQMLNVARTGSKEDLQQAAREVVGKWNK